MNNKKTIRFFKILPILFMLAALPLALSLGIGATEAFAKDKPKNNQNYAGGYTGPSLTAVTVAEAKKLGDDTPVVLVGYIVQQLNKKDYTFKDDTGTVTVEIDPWRWNGQEIGPDDLVEIRGEVDKDLFEFEIEVKTIIKRSDKTI